MCDIKIHIQKGVFFPLPTDRSNVMEVQRSYLKTSPLGIVILIFKPR
jgi:hypothetical protein